MSHEFGFLDDISDEMVYLAPEYKLTDQEGLVADDVLTNAVQEAFQIRHAQIMQEKAIYPFLETAKSLGHWIYIDRQLDDLQLILSSSMENSDNVSDLVLQMGGVMAAHQSISVQMYNLYLNVFQIAKNILEDAELSKVVADSAVEFASEKLGYDIESHMQLELNLSS